MNLIEIIQFTNFRDSLRSKLNNIEKKTEEQSESLREFTIRSRKELLDSNVTIPLLQRELVSSTANTQSKKRKLKNLEEIQQEKR